jgi:hypothetical protein
MPRTIAGRSLAFSLALLVSQVFVPVSYAASTHVVDPAQMSARLAARAQARAEQVRRVQDALASPEADRQARAMGLDARRMRAVVPHLSDSELKDLSQRAAGVQDVKAGHSSNDGVVILGIVLLLAGLAVLIAVGDYDDYYDDCYCY